MAAEKLSADLLKGPNAIDDDELEAKVDEICRAIMPAVKDRIRDLIRSATERLAGKLARAEDELARTRQDLRDKEEQIRMRDASLAWVAEAVKKQNVALRGLEALVNNAAAVLTSSSAPRPRVVRQNQAKSTAGLAPGGSSANLSGSSSQSAPIKVESRDDAEPTSKRQS